MSEFNILESARIARGLGGDSPQAMMMGTGLNVLQSHVFFAGSASAVSSPFAADTTIVRIQADVDVRYIVNSNPTATQTSVPLAANVYEVIGVLAGEKIAFITDA